jgi:hypothetical protein
MWMLCGSAVSRLLDRVARATRRAEQTASSSSV